MAEEPLDVLMEFIAAFIALILVGAVALTILTSDGRLGSIGFGFVAVATLFVGAVTRELLSDDRTLAAEHGRSRARHRLVFVGGFLAFFVVMEVAARLIRVLEIGGIVGFPDSIVMAIVFGGPLLVSALSAYFRGRVLDGFIIGAVPIIYLGIRTLIDGALGLSNSSPDSPWTFILFLLPLYAVPAALVGFVVGAGARRLVGGLRHSNP